MRRWPAVSMASGRVTAPWWGHRVARAVTNDPGSARGAYYREKAAMARARADREKDPEAHTMMMEVAALWDVMATNADRNIRPS